MSDVRVLVSRSETSLIATLSFVRPAQAGTHSPAAQSLGTWTPARVHPRTGLRPDPRAGTIRKASRNLPKAGSGFRTLAGIELDDEVGFHRDRIGHVGELGCTDEAAAHAVVVDLDVIRDVPLARPRRFQHEDHFLGLLLQLDRVAVLDLVRRDVDAPAVDEDVAVVDELARRERGRHQLHAVDDGVETPLQQLDEVLAGVAAPPHRLLVETAELALADIGVIALQLLLGRQLGPVIRRLLAPLAVLA